MAAGTLTPGPATNNESLRKKCRDAARKIRGKETGDLESEHETEQAMGDLESEHETEQPMGDLESEHETEQPMGDLESEHETEQVMGDLESEHETEQAMGDLENEQEPEHETEQDNLLLLATTVLENGQQQQQEYVDVLDWDKQQIQNAINFALAIDFKRIPRYVRDSHDKVIPLHSRSQFTKEERALILLQANTWGFQDTTNNFIERQQIAKAACHQMAYDCGYKKPVGASQVFTWQKHLEQKLIVGDPKSGLQKQHKGSQKVLGKLEKSHPGYVRELFRYAQKERGPKATFTELAVLMKAKSADPRDARPTIPKLDRFQVAAWFKANKGVFRRVAPRPLLSNEHKAKRMEWARKHYNKVKDKTAPVAYLDEKWMYTESGRLRDKQLPSAGNENIRYNPPKIVSRQHPVKVMYLGVVARPQMSKGFDGRVFLKRVSESTEYTKTTRNKQFHDNEDINREINDGAWRQLYSDLKDVYDDMTVAELLLALSDFFELCDEVADFLQLCQRVGTQNRLKPLKDEDQLSSFDIDKLELSCCYPQGHKVEVDVSCDSKFMLANMDAVGKTLREKFHWVDKEEKIYLVMDNAGGHGTKQAKETYRQTLEEKYNVEIIWQVPRSPETNMLDRGVWMSIQNKVEKAHFGMRPTHDALARSIERAWTEGLQPKAFEKVWGRLHKVLTLIVQDNGGNNLVETQRGKLFRDPDLDDEHANAEQNNNSNEATAGET